MTEIKIDRNSLPEDGQRIKWQTKADIDSETWKEGTFCAGDDIFCEGFEGSADAWDLVWDVYHWEPLPE